MTAAVDVQEGAGVPGARLVDLGSRNRQGRPCQLAACRPLGNGKLDREVRRGDQDMLPNTLAELLKLSAGERAEIAMALWASLTDTEREVELALTAEQAAELDTRLAEHVAHPESAVSWDEVRRKLTGGG